MKNLHCWALALGVGMMFCGGCASPPMDLPGQPKPAAIIEMHLHDFDPASVTIHAGQAVLWRNTTTLVWHTVTADPAKAKDKVHVELPPGVEPFDSGKIASGDAWEHVFTKPGLYRYFCIPHEEMGMVGEVIVEP